METLPLPPWNIGAFPILSRKDDDFAWMQKDDKPVGASGTMFDLGDYTTNVQTPPNSGFGNLIRMLINAAATQSMGPTVSGLAILMGTSLASTPLGMITLGTGAVVSIAASIYAFYSTKSKLNITINNAMLISSLLTTSGSMGALRIPLVLLNIFLGYQLFSRVFVEQKINKKISMFVIWISLVFICMDFGTYLELARNEVKHSAAERGVLQLVSMGLISSQNQFPTTSFDYFQDNTPAQDIINTLSSLPHNTTIPAVVERYLEEYNETIDPDTRLAKGNAVISIHPGTIAALDSYPVPKSSTTTAIGQLTVAGLVEVPGIGGPTESIMRLLRGDGTGKVSEFVTLTPKGVQRLNELNLQVEMSWVYDRNLYDEMNALDSRSFQPWMENLREIGAALHGWSIVEERMQKVWYMGDEFVHEMEQKWLVRPTAMATSVLPLIPSLENTNIYWMLLLTLNHMREREGELDKFFIWTFALALIGPGVYNHKVLLEHSVYIQASLAFFVIFTGGMYWTVNNTETAGQSLTGDPKIAQHSVRYKIELDHKWYYMQGTTNESQLVRNLSRMVEVIPKKGR